MPHHNPHRRNHNNGQGEEGRDLPGLSAARIEIVPLWKIVTVRIGE